MDFIKYKIPLIMYSHTEVDSKGNCLMRVMEDIDVSQVKGIEKLGVPDCWIFDYDKSHCYDKKKVEEMYAFAKKSDGFNLREVVMDCYFKDGYYIAEFLTEKPLSTIVTYDKGYDTVNEVTLKEAIEAFLDGNLSDGIGENPVGVVSYNKTTHDVWLGEKEEIKSVIEK